MVMYECTSCRKSYRSKVGLVEHRCTRGLPKGKAVGGQLPGVGTAKRLLMSRLAREGRWAAAMKTRDAVVRSCRAEGLSQKESKAFGWEEMERLYPPLDVSLVEEGPVVESEAGLEESAPTDEVRVNGVAVPGEPPRAEETGFESQVKIPGLWGELPATSPFPGQVEWVAANRLLVIEERASGRPRLHLARAKEPAPSRAAIGLMQFASTNQKGFMDIVAKLGLGVDDADDAGLVRRERIKIAEIGRILDRMEEAMKTDV